MNVYFVFPENLYMKMGFHRFFLDIVLYLKEKCSANIIQNEINKDFIFIEKYNHEMRDCELIIEDEKNDKLIVLSVCESRNWGNEDKNNDIWNILTERNNPNDAIVITHYTSWFHHGMDFTNQYNFKIFKTSFFPFNPWINNEYFYKLRKFKKQDDFIDKMFFMSSTRREDPFKLYELGYCTNPDLRYTAEMYLNNAINYKVGLSFSSVAELCYREIDYMGIGLPTLRLEYKITTNPPLIPNYHYISVDRDKYDLYGKENDMEWGTHIDRLGGEKYVNAYIERFLEVKDDYDFLSFISKNAYNYFQENCTQENSLKNIIKMLNL
jgi:hypothetical protein